MIIALFQLTSPARAQDDAFAASSPRLELGLLARPEWAPTPASVVPASFASPGSRTLPLDETCGPGSRIVGALWPTSPIPGNGQADWFPPEIDSLPDADWAASPLTPSCGWLRNPAERHLGEHGTVAGSSFTLGATPRGSWSTVVTWDRAIPGEGDALDMVRVASDISVLSGLRTFGSVNLARKGADAPLARDHDMGEFILGSEYLLGLSPRLDLQLGIRGDATFLPVTPSGGGQNLGALLYLRLSGKREVGDGVAYR